MNFAREECEGKGSGATTQRGAGLRTTSPRDKSPDINRNDQFSKVLIGWES
jgi:hypothetical protein